MKKEEVIEKLKEFRNINIKSRFEPIQPHHLQELSEEYSKFVKEEVMGYVSDRSVMTEMTKTDEYIGNMFKFLNFTPQVENETVPNPGVKGEDTLGSWLKSSLGT